MKAVIDYDGRSFRPVNGGGNDPATGHYHQSGDLVWAEYSGSGVRAGRLVGQRGPDGTIDAAYCHVTADGEVVAGRVTSSPTVLADGRLRLDERWHRIDGSSGISSVEEVPDD